MKNIPEGHADHSFIRTPKQLISRDPYNADIPFSQTITCESTTWHYTGERPCTLREVACLQGFPLNHFFGKQGVRRQIGNAVPPLVMNVLLQNIVKRLRKTDSIRKSP